MENKIIYFLFLLGAVGLVYCNTSTGFKADLNQYASLKDSVNYVGMATCRSCHLEAYNSFMETGMGQSFGHATKEKTAAFYGSHAVVYDEKSDFYYQPSFRDSTLYITEYRLVGKDTTHKREEKISYIIGSGHHTNSHLIDENGYVFQAPITFYTQDGRWDMAPGFENENLRFSRILTTECLTCHNQYPEHEEGSLNKYSSMPTGISCERCHGPGEAHVREKLAGNIVDTSKYIDYSIVNPRDLPKNLQMDLCQRCHLQGIAVLEDGKTFYDFKPGMPLSSVANVFLPRYTNSHEKFIMASQADRLRLSKCYTSSEEMTCLTCHHPHHSVRKVEKASFNKPCISCHVEKKVADCSVPFAARQLQEDNCVSCHMPPSGSTDIPHVNITDHFISKSTAKEMPFVEEVKKEEIARFLGLEILTKEKGSPIEMARGYMAMFDKYIEADAVLDSAAHYLSLVDSENPLLFKTKVHFFFSKKAYQEIIRLTTNREASTIKDAWTAYRIGEAQAAVNDHAKALLYYKRATKLMPLNLEFQEKQGSTYIALQYLPQAKKIFDFVLSENPKREQALNNLGYIAALQGQFEEAENYYDKALALNPDYEQALMNKIALYRFLKKEQKMKPLIERVLKINPENEDVKLLL
ncbi:MAG: tetratricopeptide repeat protein [Saprospiraceae bacterium]